MSASLRIGMIGLDTSHAPAFTHLLNDPEVEHHVPGGKVVIAYPGGSDDFELSRSRVAGFTDELRDKWGVRMVASPAEVAAESDLLFITSADGRVHLSQFKEVLPYGKPTYIDKPLAVRSDHAQEIFKLAREAGVTVMSSSSLRYMDGLTAALSSQKLQELGPIVGCDTFGPMALEPTQPGLYWYGIHQVEIVMRVMGVGCRAVQVNTNTNCDLVTATWHDGRVASMRGTRAAHGRFGLTVHHEKGFQHVDMAAGRPGYAGLIEAVIKTVPSGRPDVPAEQTLELIRLIEAANESRESGSVVVL